MAEEIKDILVVAGAGSGKTETIATMYVEYVLTAWKKAKNSPKKLKEIIESVFMTSFTNAAAEEMKARIKGKFAAEGIDVEKEWLQIMTFDAYHMRNIVNHYEFIGYTSPPRPISERQAKKIVKGIVLHPEIPNLNYENLKMLRIGAIDVVYRTFELITSLGVDPTTKEGCDKVMDALADSDDKSLKKIDYVALNEIFKRYQTYEDLLIKNNLISFGDMSKYGLMLLHDHPEIADEYPYKMIMIDEGQDTDNRQIETARILRHRNGINSVMVGDDNQAIYGFRGTNADNLIHFREKMELDPAEFKTFFLMDNRRSTPEILELADKFVAKNVNKIQKASVPFRDHGVQPVVRAFLDKPTGGKENTEQKYIIENIQKMHEAGTPWSDMAIIVRVGGGENGVNSYCSALAAAGIPAVSKSPMKLLDNSRVMGAIALFDALGTPNGDINYRNYLVALCDGQMDEENADFFAEEQQKMRAVFTNLPFKSLDDQRRIFHEYLEALRRPTDEVYDEFINDLYSCEDLPSEVEAVQDMIDLAPNSAKKTEQDYEGVVVTTAHSSKGLEWPVVFVSLTDFDSPRLHRGHSHDDEIEETRRLIYVAMTRARDVLYVTGRGWAYGVKDDKTFNQFLKELYDVTRMDFSAIVQEYSTREAAEALEAAEKAHQRKLEKQAEKAAKMKKDGLDVLGLGMVKRNRYISRSSR